MADWNDVRYFLEIVRSGTLAGAGRNLKVDYTTVGRRLAALERDLGARLLQKTPDGFVLTPAGESIRAAGEEMERAALALERRAFAADNALEGVVRVTTTETIGQVIVLPAIRGMRERAPEIRIELIVGPASLDMARREADLALRYVRPHNPELVARRIARVAIAPYASREYLARREVAQGTGFEGHDLVALDERIRPAAELEVGGERVRGARLVLRSNSALALVEAAARGMGIAELPCCLADARPELVRVFPELAPRVKELWLVLHADVQRARRVRAVVEAIEAEVLARASELAGAAPRPRVRRRG